MSNNISIYGSHNAAIALKLDGRYRVIEVERFLNKKNQSLTQYRSCVYPYVVMDNIVSYLDRMLSVPNQFDNCIYSNTEGYYGDTLVLAHTKIKASNYINSPWHHMCHAAGTFYQSPYREAIVFSYDGGGSDGCFCIYHATRENSVSELARIDLDLGFAYMILGHYLEPIKFESDLNIGNLVYAGKLMGLCGYGKVRQEWVDSFISFYEAKPNGINYGELTAKLGERIGVAFDIFNRVELNTAVDIAATSQYVFEKLFFSSVESYLNLYPDLPVCVTGGCALNVVCNTKLKEEFNREVFVAPNSNDCGIALGMLLNYEKPAEQVDITYCGLPVLDPFTIAESIETRYTIPYDIHRAASILRDGEIVGVVRGNSEHGPRALGNRSILCNPAIAGMKDKLNKLVKQREWYRPFAPVVRLEDVEKYFNWKGESRFMSFYCTVKDQWREQLAAITHIDGTARLQTVTREQNTYLYDLLTEFDRIANFGVLLNTSFNINGKPLINTYKDALHMLDKSGINKLFTDDFIVYKELNI